MIEDICKWTNKYAWTFILDKPSYAKPDGSWAEVSSEEMMKLIGLIIFMGAFNSHSISKFWSTTSSLAAPAHIRKVMSRTRFQAIMSFLHVVDPDMEDRTDKLCKVRTFLTQMKHNCQNVYKPYEHLSVDERMVRSKHRTSIRQYIKDKPVKFGFKLWVIADSSNGYTFDFDVYTGKGENTSNKGLGYDVVMKLCATLFNQGYYIFFDNFYSSPTLVRDLWLNGLKACGTITERRRGFPEVLKRTQRVPHQKKKYDNKGNLKPPKRKAWGKLTARGNVRWLRQDNLLFLQWKDKKVVTMISNAHAGGGFVPATRRVKDKVTERWHTIEVNKPNVIDTYNKYMSGVDRSDQLIGKYNVLMTCVRWWKVLFFHCIDIAVVNSYILFQLWRAKYPNRPELQRTSHYGQLEFREELFHALMDVQVPVDVPVQPPAVIPAPHEFTHQPVIVDKTKNCTRCYLSEKVERKTSMSCSDCRNTYLCCFRMRNCYQEWHSVRYEADRNHRNKL